MNISRLLKRANDKESIRKLLCAATEAPLHAFLMSHGYLLTEENIRSIFTSARVNIAAEIMGAYMPDDVLDKMQNATLISAPQLLRRLSRKQLKERMIINDVRITSHRTATELCAIIKNYIPSLKNDYPVTAIAARKLYSYCIKNDCPLDVAPYMFKYVMPYANRAQMRRLISHFWQQYQKMNEEARQYDISYRLEHSTELCNTFLSLLPCISIVSPRDAVRFAHIMLTTYDCVSQRIIKRFPMGADRRLYFLPHHRLMYLLLSWAANIGMATSVLWPSSPTLKELNDCIAAMMRLGSLYARMPSALRLRMGMAFPGIVNCRLFTRAEVSKLKVIKGIDKVGW